MKTHPQIRTGLSLVWLAMLPLLVTGAPESDSEGFVRLFPKAGVPQGWLVRAWNDVSLPVDASVQWQVTDGILHGSTQRGTWLMSARQYTDFVLRYEF